MTTSKSPFLRTDKKSDIVKSHQYHHALGQNDRKNTNNIPDYRNGTIFAN